MKTMIVVMLLGLLLSVPVQAGWVSVGACLDSPDGGGKIQIDDLKKQGRLNKTCQGQDRDFQGRSIAKSHYSGKWRCTKKGSLDILCSGKNYKRF